MKRASSRSGDRSQSEVVGVALLLGLAVVGMGVLTLTVGVTLEENAAAADASRVAADLEEGIDPVATTGTRRSSLSFSDGTLRTTDRTMRLLNGDDVASTWEVGAIVYETEGHRVVSAGGAVVESRGEYARVRDEPPMTVSPGVFLLTVVDIDPVNPVSYGGTSTSTLTLETTVSHERTDLGVGDYAVAVETAHPDAWIRAFERQGASTTVESFDSDDERSVVARFDGEHTGYVVVHDVELEAFHG